MFSDRFPCLHVYFMCSLCDRQRLFSNFYLKSFSSFINQKMQNEILCNSSIFLQGISNEFFSSPSSISSHFFYRFRFDVLLENTIIRHRLGILETRHLYQVYCHSNLFAVYFLFYSYHLQTYFFGQLFHIHLFGVSLRFIKTIQTEMPSIGSLVI